MFPQNWISKIHVDVIRMDLSNAFDSMDNRIFLHKLSSYGFTNNTSLSTVVLSQLQIQLCPLPITVLNPSGSPFNQVYHKDPTWIHFYLSLIEMICCHFYHILLSPLQMI